MASSSSSSSSGSGSSSSAADVGLKSATSNPDSCMWYANAECSKPRTCYDCLNVAIPSGGCAIDPRGQCVTQADYQSFVKARAYYYPNYKYYPSDSYTYCSALDATCQLCKQKWIQDYYAFGNTPAIPFCTGAGGCVCVAYCELPGWTDTVLGNQCSSSGGATDIDSPKLFGSVGLTIGFVVLFLAVVVGARFVMQRLHWNGNNRNRDLPRREPSGPQLSLNGWKSMREKLIASERHHIEGRSAPTHSISDEAPAVVLEEGAGYRPESPSQLGAHR